MDEKIRICNKVAHWCWYSLLPALYFGASVGSEVNLQIVYGKTDIFIFNMWLNCMYICAPYACSIHGDQKHPLDSLRLELEQVLNHCVVLGIEPESSGRAAVALN